MNTTLSNGHLLFLLADLARDRHLVDRLALDAESVFREYDVPPETLAILRSRDATRIVAEVAAQARSLLPVITTPPHGLLAWAWPEEEERKSIELGPQERRMAVEPARGAATLSTKI